MAAPSKAYVLSLYRGLLRHGNQFASYNFRLYAVRRSKDAFRANVNETDPSKIEALIHEAEENLVLVKRQAAISQMYTKHEPLVVEKAHH